MRRTTATTIVEQARLLHTLLKSSPDLSAMHHAWDIEQYFLMLVQRCQITHSVSPRFPQKNNLSIKELLTMYGLHTSESFIVNGKRKIGLVLEDIIDHKIKITPVSERTKYS